MASPASPDRTTARILFAAAVTAACFAALVLGFGVTGQKQAAESAEEPGVESTSSTTVPSTATSRSTTPTSATSTSTTSTTSTRPGARDVLASLIINDAEPAGGYVRDLFPTWLDLDGNGCDARDDILAASSSTPAVRSGCGVVSGTWRSLYDGVTTTDPSTLDVDHVVPLVEAWVSGASTWDAARRAAYANDTAASGHLLAVSATSNRSKGEEDPAQWRPLDEGAWCSYAENWISIKARWRLTVDTPERDALGQMLDRC